MTDEPVSKKPKLCEPKLEWYLSLIPCAQNGPEAPCHASSDVGIKYFLTESNSANGSLHVTEEPSEKINGRLKTFISDFVVREVNNEGIPANITKIHYSVEEIDKLNGMDAPIDDLSKLPRELSREKLIAILGENNFQKIEELAKETNRDFTLNQKDLPETSDLKDKTLRKNIHILIRNLFEHKISSNIKNGETIEIFKKLKSNENIDIRDRQTIGRRKNEKTNKEVLRFVLQKRNLDTISAIDKICKMIRVNPKTNLIKYAGVKDRRGVTTQFCTTILDCRKVLELNKQIKPKNENKNEIPMLQVGNFEKYHEHYNIGCLKGNQFCLIVRNTNLTNEMVDTFKNYGFINYFGLQRFGLSSPTCLIGLALIKGDYKTAVDLALHNFNCKTSFTIKKAKEHYSLNQDATEALNILGYRTNGLEKLLFKGIERMLDKSPHSKDWLSVFQTLPRNFKSLFLHAYQSWLFNQLVNFRLQKSSNKLLIGDFVITDEDYSQKKITEIKTQEVIDSGKYSFKDLALPIIGYNVEIPQNLEYELYSLLKIHEIDLSDFKNSVKDLSLAGTYRRVFVKFTENFESDFVMIPKNKNQEEKQEIVDLQDATGNWLEIGDRQEDLKEEEFENCLRIKFELPSSAYATCAVRQLLRNNDVTHSFEK